MPLFEVSGSCGPVSLLTKMSVLNRIVPNRAPVRVGIGFLNRANYACRKRV